MNPFDVKSNTYIESSEEINDKNPNFQNGDNVGISKYQNIFAKVTVVRRYVINDTKRIAKSIVKRI